MKAKTNPLKKIINIGKITNYNLIPDLIAIQFKSYNEFLQKEIEPHKRKNTGLEQVFRESFPIVAQNGEITIEYESYQLGEPKWSPSECKSRGLTYSLSLRARIRIINNKTGEIREQDVYFGEIPLMTPNGTFIINGAERVVVSQLHRSPGIFFFYDSEKKVYSAKIIPSKGSWLEIELEPKGIITVKIDKKKKVPATLFLRALVTEKGTDEEILKIFYPYEEINLKNLTGKELERITRRGIIRLAKDVVNSKGEVLYKSGESLDEEAINYLKEQEVDKIEIIVFYDKKDDTLIINTIQEEGRKKDEKSKSRDSLRVTAVKKILEYLKGENFDKELKDPIEILEEHFFNEKNYDLSPVGRFKVNNKFVYLDGSEKKEFLNIPENSTRALRKIDIIETFKYFVNLIHEERDYYLDDIDHLGNRRVRSVGELLTNQLKASFAKLERIIKERLSSAEIDVLTPQSLISNKPVISAINDFFGLGQLSQFMDQTNPLSELTHKRRLNALGPGGLNRERAGFEVRDIHYSHYGRMCPIETPEGQNIGLIVSMSTMAQANEFGFLVSPYRKVIKEKDNKDRIINVKVSDEIVYLTADIEERFAIAQANTPLNPDGTFKQKLVECRKKDDYPLLPPEEVDFMDVAPLQVVSVSTSLIPFLEHDDANRALMGSNMQRQALPLLVDEAPLICTGMEEKVAYDSRVCMIADVDGVVVKVDAQKIIVKRSDGREKIYYLRKFERTNQDTLFNHKPVVDVIIFDHKKWNPEKRKYIYPDSSKVTKITNDKIEIEVKFEDESEILSIPLLQGDKEYQPFVKENSNIKNGTVLVGQKVYKEIRDEKGLVIRKGTIIAEGPSIDNKRLALGKNVLVAFMPFEGFNFEDAIIISDRLVKDDVFTSIHIEEYEVLARETKLGPEQITRDIPNISDKAFRDLDENGIIRIGAEVKSGDILVGKVTPQVEKDMSPEYKLLHSIFGEKARDVKDTSLRVPNGVEGIVIDVKHYMRKNGDELSSGVEEMVKVYIASKRKIQVGDKMAGRHGNKGVISKVLPVEDMPFLEDGTPVDIVLNPLGVPSRMNIGQIFETMLGFAAHELNYIIETPVFDGATEDDIKIYLQEAGLSLDCKFNLYNGKTGEKFENKVFCGYIYMLKLAHMVEDKMHARSTGPYSLVTQQPLGGKAQFGGQRLGEMEVWALEAYGAAYNLQELLSVKSDDMLGRARIYEAIIKGIHTIKPGIPESFNVLLQELRGLAIDIRMFDEKGSEVEILDEETSVSKTKNKIRLETIERN